MYDEIYFASTDELNDPVDMQSKFIFSTDSKELWKKMLFQLWADQNYADIGSSYFAEICPITYDSLIINFDYHAEKLFERLVDNKSLNPDNIKYILLFIKKLKNFINLYEPSAGYSVSFSKACDDMLMWSHYAKRHTGFCLIFRPINNSIYQCPTRQKDNISVTRGHNTCIGESFPVYDIDYEDELSDIDAFTLFPIPYTGYHFDEEEERLNYHKSARDQLLTKNKVWGYEEECRLLLPQPQKRISGEANLNCHQRLFHYDFMQIAGIIFGHRMSSQDKDSIRNILNEKLEKRTKSLSENSKEKIIFDFLFQQAEICPNSRNVKINNLDLVSMGSIIKPGTEYYDRQLEKWYKGEGIRYQSGNLSYDPIP